MHLKAMGSLQRRSILGHKVDRRNGAREDRPKHEAVIGSSGWGVQGPACHVRV